MTENKHSENTCHAVADQLVSKERPAYLEAVQSPAWKVSEFSLWRIGRLTGLPGRRFNKAVNGSAYRRPEHRKPNYVVGREMGL